MALGAIQVVLLVLWALPSAPATNVSVAAAALGLPVALAMGLLSHAQHVRSVRPSTLLNIYLLLSLLCDIVQTRTLWLLHRATAIAAVFTASVFLKLVVLMTEAVEKRRLLEGKHQDATVESTSGIWNKMLFWWVNPLLWKGSRSILQPNDLQTINEKLHGAALEKVHPGVLARSRKPGPLFYYIFHTHDILTCFINAQWPNRTEGMDSLLNSCVHFGYRLYLPASHVCVFSASHLHNHS